MEAKQLLQFLLVISLFSLSGCTTYEVFEQPTTAPMMNKLQNYRPPERKVEIAVYKFNDQTGQRKPSDSHCYNRNFTAAANGWSAFNFFLFF